VSTLVLLWDTPSMVTFSLNEFDGVFGLSLLVSFVVL
jgi:hypothetical protein